MRRLKTNKTQILHRIRFKKFVPNTPLENNYSGEKLQPDEEIVIPQDDLYTISWEEDFDHEYLKREKVIGWTRQCIYRTKPPAARWIITSPEMNAAAQIKMNNAATSKRMKVTSTGTK